MFTAANSEHKQLFFVLEVYLEYGYHYTLNSYYLCYEPRITDKIFARIRNYRDSTPDTYPDTLAGHKVLNVR